MTRFSIYQSHICPLNPLAPFTKRSQSSGHERTVTESQKQARRTQSCFSTVSTIVAVGVGPCHSPGVAGAGLSGAAQAVPSKAETTRTQPTAATITQSPSPRALNPRRTLPCPPTRGD